MPTLYLIPTPIAGEALHTIPPYVQEIARRLDVFIAERAKTARHFIKSLGPAKPLPEILVVELSDDSDPEEARHAFREAIKDGRDVGQHPGLRQLAVAVAVPRGFPRMNAAAVRTTMRSW